jgi:hypothetical protein
MATTLRAKWWVFDSALPYLKAFMATYNIDLFRDFLFNSSFLKRYKIKYEILKKVKKDDVELMKLGFEWVKYFLWGIKTKSIRNR